MSIDVEVGLISGRRATVQAALDESVGTLKRRAQIALGLSAGLGRLLDPSGCVLAGWAPIKKAWVQHGDSLTLLTTNPAQVQACYAAFAAILADGSVVTWGVDSTAVQDQLKTVQQIRACRFGAFAAVLDDGFVVTWGDAMFGADSSVVQGQLRNVQQIQASSGAFAAIRGDGAVVTWGDAAHGGDSSAVQSQLKNVQQIQATRSAFAAILGEGSVVTWGDVARGGDSRDVQGRLKDVQQIQASSGALLPCFAMDPL